MTVARATSQPCVKAFCPGQAKSGTASLAGLLADCGAVHEPERPQTLDLILRTSRGELTDEALRSRLLERDARMAVPYDIAWANQFLLPHLVTTFPAARFVVLLRDC